YPCLVDERHVVAELYGMVNVPSAVWVNEVGRIVRPTEVAGASDAFRTHMDRQTKQMSAEGIADRQRTRTAYLNALRDWTAKGAESTFALSSDEVRQRRCLEEEAGALLAGAVQRDSAGGRRSGQHQGEDVGRHTGPTIRRATATPAPNARPKTKCESGRQRLLSA